MDGMPATHSALALLATAATGGSIPVAYWAWALNAASNPQVHNAVGQVGTVAATAAKGMATSAAYAVHDGICVNYWVLIIVFNAFLIMCLFAFLCSFSSFVVAGEGGWWLARSRWRSQHGGSADRYHLQELALFISNGGEPAIQETAVRLEISPEAVQT